MKKRLVPNFELAFEHAEELTGFQLWKVANLWQRKMKETLDPLGVTPVQFLLLNSIATLNNQQSGAITQNRLAEFADCDKMMVSKVLRTLEERKLVERRAHHSDTRSRSLFITNKGMELLRTSSPVLLKTESAFFEALGKKEKNLQKRFSKLLRFHNGQGSSPDDDSDD